MEDAFGEQTYGEAHVTQPELSGSAINQYYTYLVTTKLADDSGQLTQNIVVSSRKRYSDFEWLRTALASCLPGVRIPPLPKKQSAGAGLLAKTGRVDEAFLETRRAGLEDFLRRCFQRKELCIGSKLLKNFLGTADETAMDEFKKKIDNVSPAGKLKKFQEIYEEELKEANLPEDDRITPFKTFLADQTLQLRELADGFKEVVDAQGAATKALWNAHLKLAAISHSEAGTLASAGFPKDARVDLVEGLHQQNKVLQDSPSMHYDLLFEAAERELLEAEAMQEAVDSVEQTLPTELTEARARAENLGEALRKVEDGGEIPSTGTGVARLLGMVPKKDRKEKIDEMKLDLEQKQKHVTSLEELQRLARTVLISREIDSFFNEKVKGHRQAKDAFAGFAQSSSERLCTIWGGSVRELIASQGYPTSPERAPAADVEYE